MNKTSVLDFLVVSNMEIDTKEEVIIKLIDNLEEKNYLSDKQIFLQDVLERENTLPTYIGNEIGLPHNQSEGVRIPSVTVGRLNHPVVWTEDGDLVDAVFLIGVPKQSEENLHLKILSKLARLLMHEDFRNEIRTTEEKVLTEMLNKKVKEEIE